MAIKNTIYNQVAERLAYLKEHNVPGPYAIVPVVNKKCFVPCFPGQCNCNPNIDKKWCLVTESFRPHAMNDILHEITSINRILKQVESE